MDSIYARKQVACAALKVMKSKLKDMRAIGDVKRDNRKVFLQNLFYVSDELRRSEYDLSIPVVFVPPLRGVFDERPFRIIADQCVDEELFNPKTLYETNFSLSTNGKDVALEWAQETGLYSVIEKVFSNTS